MHRCRRGRGIVQGNFVTSETMAKGIWNRSHYLDRMTLKELWIAYFQYPAIIAYIALAVVCVGVWELYPATPLQTLAAAGATVLAYPLVWYAIHRWVLHSNWMFKVPLLASTWKRIHYDHHQDPNHLEVLFGALQWMVWQWWMSASPGSRMPGPSRSRWMTCSAPPT